MVGEYLCDTRFNYGSDNPFSGDPNKIKLRQLKKYIDNHSEDFTNIDYKNDSRYLIMMPNTTHLFGTKISDIDINQTQLGNRVKNFLSKQSFLSEDLRTWCQSYNPETVNESEETPDENISCPTNLEPITTTPLISKINSGYSNIISNVTYDISNEKTMSYEELKNLTMRIARSTINSNTPKDDTVLFLEKEKRRNLINEIKEFKNVDKINPHIEDDLQSMNIEQLENCRDKCEKLHSRFKVDEVLNSSFNLGSIAYDVIFPEGIPVSQTKRIKFGGVGTAIRNKFFDPRKTTGFSFSRVLSKYNINISDEMAIMLAVGETVVSNMKIVDVAPKTPKLPKIENTSRKKSITMPKIGPNIELNNNKDDEDIDEYDNEDGDEDDNENELNLDEV